VLAVIETGAFNPNIAPPPGYQAVVVIADNSHLVEVVSGNLQVTDTSPSNGDTLAGGPGNDTLIGSTNTVLIGGSGPTTIYGGIADTIYGGSGPTTIYGGVDDTIAAGSGNTLIYGAPGASLTGGTGRDTIHGAVGDTISSGQSGNELIDAHAGFEVVDSIHGSVADLTVIGGTHDTIGGNAGNDHFNLGSGQDQLIVAQGGGNDTVTDFSKAAGDRIAFAGETTKEIRQIVATQVHTHVQGVASTVLSFPDGTQMTLVGVHHVNAGFFA
jgi:serralysin